MTQDTETEVRVLEKQAYEGEDFSFGNFYGALVKNGFKTAQFEDIYNYTMRRDSFRVCLVGGKINIKEVQ